MSQPEKSGVAMLGFSEAIVDAAAAVFCVPGVAGRSLQQPVRPEPVQHSNSRYTGFRSFSEAASGVVEVAVWF